MKYKINGKTYIKKKVLSKKALLLLLLIALGFALYNGYKIVLWAKENTQNEKIVTEIKENVTVNNDLVSINEEEKVIETVDITEVLKQNKNSVGWINLKNTNIDYPIVQTNNNDFYLNHSFDSSYNSAGWIFMDYRNNNDFTDQNTIIYGHGRKDGSMFGSLKNTLTSDWFNNKENHYLVISTINKTLVYEVFSTYEVLAEEYYITPSFVTDEEYNTWLKEMINRSAYNYNVDVTTDDLVLTLSTCSSKENHRVVLQAKLIYTSE